MSEMKKFRRQARINPSGVYRHNSHPDFGKKVSHDLIYYVTHTNIIGKHHLIDYNNENVGWFYESELMFLT